MLFVLQQKYRLFAKTDWPTFELNEIAITALV